MIPILFFLAGILCFFGIADCESQLVQDLKEVQEQVIQGQVIQEQVIQRQVIQEQYTVFEDWNRYTSNPHPLIEQKWN